MESGGYSGDGTYAASISSFMRSKGFLDVVPYVTPSLVPRSDFGILFMSCEKALYYLHLSTSRYTLLATATFQGQDKVCFS